MKKSAVLLALLMLSPLSFATSGQINFRGAIVESPCDTLIAPNQIQQSCTRGGKTIIHKVSLNNAQQPMPYKLGTVQVRQTGNVKMMTVSYN